MTRDRMVRVAWWSSTALTAVVFAGLGVADLARTAPVTAGLARLGYPAYVATILGVWKLLGAAAILASRFPRVREWAYAGMLFDLTGAAASHAASGHRAAEVLAPLVLLGGAMASRSLRPLPVLRRPPT